MKPLFVLLLVVAMLNVYGCQVRQAPPPVATAPLPPVEHVEAPKPTTPKADVDKALWHFRYARGLLEKKQ